MNGAFALRWPLGARFPPSQCSWRWQSGAAERAPQRPGPQSTRRRRGNGAVAAGRRSAALVAVLARAGILQAQAIGPDRRASDREAYRAHSEVEETSRRDHRQGRDPPHYREAGRDSRRARPRRSSNQRWRTVEPPSRSSTRSSCSASTARPTGTAKVSICAPAIAAAEGRPLLAADGADPSRWISSPDIGASVDRADAVSRLRLQVWWTGRDPRATSISSKTDIGVQSVTAPNRCGIQA
jgi:hypothetical protein